MLGIILLLVFIAIGMHISLALITASFLGIWAITGKLDVAISVFTTAPYATVASFTIAVVPLFIFMGIIAGYAGFADAAYDTTLRWVGRLPGGLSMATTIANAIFDATGARIFELPMTAERVKKALSGK